jgi:hypothetical protein
MMRGSDTQKKNATGSRIETRGERRGTDDCGVCLLLHLPGLRMHMTTRICMLVFQTGKLGASRD